jgi:hypothetical protein
MARIDVPAGETVERLRLWEMAPAIGAGVDAFRRAVYTDDTLLSIREQEVARMRIAQINECDI